MSSRHEGLMTNILPVVVPPVIMEPPALELGLRHMRKGEKALIRCSSKYAYGPVGRKVVGWGGTVEIPPDAALEYEAEVKELYPQLALKEAPTAARVFECNLKKQHGNRFFHHQDWQRAVRCYQAGLKALDPGESEEDEEGYKDIIKMYCDISNNLAATLLKMQMPKEAQEACIKVIELDKDNVKALYRGGVAAMALHNFEEAEIALKEAFKLAPKDAGIKNAIQELKQRRSTYQKKEVAMYKQMSGFLLSKKKPDASSADTAELKESSSSDKDAAVTEESEAESQSAVDASPGEAESQSNPVWPNKEPKPSIKEPKPSKKDPKPKTADAPSSEAAEVEETPPAKGLSSEFLGWTIALLAIALPLLFFWDRISPILYASEEAETSGGEL